MLIRFITLSSHKCSDTIVLFCFVLNFLLKEHRFSDRYYSYEGASIVARDDFFFFINMKENTIGTSDGSLCIVLDVFLTNRQF